MKLEFDLPDVAPEWLAPAAWGAAGLVGYLAAGAVTAGLCYRFRARGDGLYRGDRGAFWESTDDLANVLAWPFPALVFTVVRALPLLKALAYLPSRPFVWVARAAAGRD